MAWVRSELQVGLNTYLQVREEEFRTQSPEGGQLAQDPGGKEEALGKVLRLREGQTYLSLLVKISRSRPSCWNFYSRCGGDRAVLTAKESLGDGQLPPEAR